jgi:hypothetical protein
MDTASGEKIAVLTSENYQRWKFDIEVMLESRDVWDIVSGDSRCPTANTSVEERKAMKDWKRQDAIARMLIAKSLDDNHHCYIRDCTSSKDMFDTIVSMKESKSVTSKLGASSQWHAYTWEAGHNITSFLSGLSVLTTKAKSTGVTLDDVTIMGKIIESLPPSFDSFRQTWKLMATDSVTLNDLKGKLLCVETDMKKRDDTGAGGDAFFG